MDYNFQEINVSEIIINEKSRRTVNNEKVSELADSIFEIGLINPIIITTEKVLIAGLHRLLAFKQLGIFTIPCRIVNSDISSVDLELIEIDENLIRFELHYIDRGEYLIRRKELYELKYPETKQHAHLKKSQRDNSGRIITTNNETVSFVLSLFHLKSTNSLPVFCFVSGYFNS